MIKIKLVGQELSGNLYITERGTYIMDTTDKPKIKIKAVGDTVSGIVYVTEKGSYLIDVNFRGYNDKHPDCSTMDLHACCPNEPDGEPDYRLKSERFVVVDEF